MIQPLETVNLHHNLTKHSNLISYFGEKIHIYKTIPQGSVAFSVHSQASFPYTLVDFFLFFFF